MEPALFVENWLGLILNQKTANFAHPKNVNFYLKHNSMMRLTFLLVFSSVLCLNLHAQNKAVVEAPKNKNLFEVLSDSLQYVESNFQWGKVYFNDGKVTEAYLNYNLLLGEMHFILYDKELKKNKVLSIANPETISFIVFGKYVYIYDSKYGYLEVLVNTKVKLLKWEKLIVKAEDNSQSAYGTKSESSGGTNVSYLSGFNTPFPLGSDGNVLANATKEVKYFGLKSKTVKPLSSKKNLISLFPKKHHEELKGYLDSLNGSWNDANNLIEIFKFADKFKNEQ